MAMPKRILRIIKRSILKNALIGAIFGQSGKFIERAFDSMSDAISIIDAKSFTILYANKKFFEIYGPDHRAVIGKKCYAITHRQNSPCAPPYDECPLCAVVKTNTHSIAEHLHMDKYGRRQFVEVSASPITYENGQVTTVIHVSRDITEKKQMMDRLMESYKHLGVINRKLSILLELDRHIQKMEDKEAVQYILSVALNLSRAFSVSLYELKRGEDFHLMNSNSLGKTTDKKIKSINWKDSEILSGMHNFKKIMHGLANEASLGNLRKNKETEYFMALPLIKSKNGKLEGLLFFEFIEERKFSPDQLDFYEVFASHIAPLIF